MNISYKNITFLLMLSFLCYSQTLAQIDDAEYFNPDVKCHTFHRSAKQKPTFQSMQWMQTNTISPKGYFRIHYDTMGYNAVSTVDKDGNSIPDYVDSACAIFDYVYEVETLDMQYNKPFPTPWEEGNTYYDVYIRNLLMYGVTRTWDHPDNLNSSKQYTYIEVDNNYSEQDTYVDEEGKTRRLFNTSGIAGLKVTAAHEFFHAVQFAYNHFIGNNSSIFEMASVCMEMLVYPGIYDYAGYVNHMFGNLNKYHWCDGFANNGYPFGIWFYMLTAKYGRNIMKEYFEICDKNVPMFPAFDTLLKRHNSGLIPEWREFLRWIYYTGSNAIEGQYFPMASKFKTLTPTQLMENPGGYYCDLQPFDIHFIRHLNKSNDPFILSDTVDILPTNINIAGLYDGEKQSWWNTDQFSSTGDKQPITGGEEVFESYWLKISDTSSTMKCLLLAKPGGQSFKVSHVYPMPFNKSSNQWLYFPIDDNITIGKNVRLTIYDMNQSEIFSQQLATSVDSYRHRVVQYDPRNLNSGVYTFIISEENTDNLTGKFVIK